MKYKEFDDQQITDDTNRGIFVSSCARSPYDTRPRLYIPGDCENQLDLIEGARHRSGPSGETTRVTSPEGMRLRQVDPHATELMITEYLCKPDSFDYQGYLVVKIRPDAAAKVPGILRTWQARQSDKPNINWETFNQATPQMAHTGNLAATLAIRTKETSIEVIINLDSEGRNKIVPERGFFGPDGLFEIIFVRRPEASASIIEADAKNPGEGSSDRQGKEGIGITHQNVGSSNSTGSTPATQVTALISGKTAAAIGAPEAHDLLRVAIPPPLQRLREEKVRNTDIARLLGGYISEWRMRLKIHETSMPRATAFFREKGIDVQDPSLAIYAVSSSDPDQPVKLEITRSGAGPTKIFPSSCAGVDFCITDITAK